MLLLITLITIRAEGAEGFISSFLGDALCAGPCSRLHVITALLSHLPWLRGPVGEEILKVK